MRQVDTGGGIIGGNYRGECLQRLYNGDTSPVDVRVAAHLKNNRRGNGQNEWLRKMINLAKECGHNFVVVIPPVRSDYMKLTPDHQELFGELYSILEEYPQVKLISCWGDPVFLDEDFGDTDHPNEKGAEKITRKIHDCLRMWSMD